MSEPIRKYNLRLPEKLYELLQEEAKGHGVSLNAYIVGILCAAPPLEHDECDHEPFLSYQFRHCYRCGAPLSAHST